MYLCFIGRVWRWVEYDVYVYTDTLTELSRGSVQSTQTIYGTSEQLLCSLRTLLKTVMAAAAPAAAFCVVV